MIDTDKIPEYRHVRIETGSFKPAGGLAEHHAMLHVVRLDASFAVQLQEIQEACAYLLSVYGGNVRPVFKRYFLSDAANQSPALQESMDGSQACAVSVVQQPPLDGSKIALWVYLKSEAAVTRNGRFFAEEHNGYRHLWAAGWRFPETADAFGQTTALLQDYITELAQEGCLLENDCVRTWLFVQNVDVHYPAVVQARKKLFAAHRLTEQTHYIASTGIEGRHADSGTLVLFDAYTVKGLQKGQQTYLYAPTHLNPTYEYGVTFERGVSVAYGDRSHIFISGTASINNKGEIMYPEDITRQTYRMLENVGTLLAEADAGFDDVIQMVVYLRDIADYRTVCTLFENRFPSIPKIIALAPVCRPGWLVEMECIAVKEEHHPQFGAL
jgi:enamine deaminase RidA (YjgF/YER057c/UK114 family)